MMTTAVIYIFRCPKGRVYAGQRTVSPEALRCWPGAGTGPLPDGYKGSGNPWWRIARRHRNALTWRIVARVDGPQADVDAAEVRAISLARAIFGRLCVNVLPGGQGMTSEVARVVNSTPVIRAHRSATANRLWADPSFAEAQRNRLELQRSDPDWQARRAAGLVKATKAASAPEARARAKASNSVTHKGLAQTPERKALFVRAAQIGQRKRRARRALAPFCVPPSISRPGVCLWAFLPALRLSIAGPRGPARRR